MAAAEAATTAAGAIFNNIAYVGNAVVQQASAHPTVTKAVIGTTAALVAPVAVVGVVGVAGFGAAGVAAGSAAAWLMSLSGGTVAAGSTVAVLQSVGAAGLGGAAWTLATSAGAWVGWKATEAVVG